MSDARVGRIMIAGCAALTLVLWASAFPGIKAGLAGYSALELAALRFLSASLALAVVAYVKRSRWPQRAHFKLILALGVLGVTAYHVLLNVGESYSSANTAAFFISLAPLFTTIIAWRHLRETVRVATWLGIVLSIAGVVILFDVGQTAYGSTVGATLLLVAALCWSLFFVLQKPLLAAYSPFEVICYGVWVGTLPLLVLVPGAVSRIGDAPAAATFAAFYLGIGPTALAYVAWAYVLSQLPASRASLLTYLVPLISMSISYLWVDEVPSVAFLAGAGLVLLGVVLGTGVALLELRARSQP